MPAHLTSLSSISPIDDRSMLLVGLRDCLTMADRLGLSMVSIHIEQACDWLTVQDGRVTGGNAIADPKPVVTIAPPSA
ncbi:hypothetical protein RN629_00940 [Sphingomonadaceae bacterium jetA1]|jgi:hypothetical protein|uniref:hypothetical protein n=1 Tax=Facivitalis istanbulensis TaxID=3075838 RepID=UPI00347B95A6